MKATATQNTTNLMKTRFSNLVPLVSACIYLLMMQICAVAQPQFGLNPQLNALTAKGSSPSLLYFKPELNLDAKNIFATHKQAFMLGTYDQMKMHHVDTCSLGDVHYEFQQSHRGIPVEGAYYIVHERAGKAESGNGTIIPNLNLNINPQVSEAAALQSAINAFGATQYQWEVPSMETWLKTIKNDPNATFYPSGKLVIFNPILDKNPANFRLAWEFLISSRIPFNSMIVYVDAQTGTVLRSFPRISSTSAVGSATTVYSGVRPIVTDYIGFFSKTYRLIDNTRGAGIQTWNIRDYDDVDSAVNFTDADNIWNNVNADQDQYATDAHWGLEVTYDYFKNVHAHRGIDGADAKKMNAYVHWGGAFANNAFYWSGGGDIFGFGDGNAVTTNPKVSLDIVAHEFTHGVTQHVVSPPNGLEYQDEPGQLNEAYSDIFGVLVEYWVKGNNPGLWLFGEDVYINNNYTRNIPNPKLKGQPSTYKKAPWYFGAGDYGGVHYNNSVGTLWFYYLAAGGSGKNDNGDDFSVKGIGLAKAEKIAFRTLSHYHTRFDQYADARTLSFKSAMDLYGTTKPEDPCCEEARQVLNAWYAVGVGDPLLMFEKVEIKKADCDSANGEATAFVKGVKGTPKFAWSNGDTTAKADSLAPGEYTVTVTDTSTGCQIDTTITIKENANFYFDAMAAGIYQCGVNDGWARVFFVVTGTPEILWSNGGKTEKIENLAPGDYSVTVTDTSTGCSRDTTVTVIDWGPEVQIAGGGNRTICKGQPMPSFTLTAITRFCYNCEYTWSTGAKSQSITVSAPGGYSVTVKTGNCTATAGTTVTVWEKDCDDPDEWEIPIIQSSDPNDITGPQGYGEQQFVNPISPMNYLIRFENDPDFATAAALKVIVTAPLHPNTSLFTFKLGDFGFANLIFHVPENTTFYTKRLDVSDSLGVAVDVTAGINVATREAFWIFNAVDPLTGLEPTDAALGFLPVNDSITHRGEGFVNFSIQPAPNLITGDSVSKQAVIVFDLNEEIPTNIWTNLIDAVPPASQVDSLPMHSGSTNIPIRFSGQDDIGGSGIGAYSLYYSKDNGPFTFYKEFSTDTNAYFSGEAEAEYRFFSRAKDNVGNEEAMKDIGEAVTILHKEPVYFWNLMGNVRYANPAGTALIGVSLDIYDAFNDTTLKTLSNGAGQFTIGELRQGDYEITAAYDGTWGGGNATDALLIMKHFVNLDTLTGVYTVAADVNASGYINATDAQQVASRFVNVIDNFPSGDWAFYPGEIDLAQDTFLNVKALCYGDVNGSFIPGHKIAASLSLHSDQVMYVGKDIEYTIPIKVNRNIALNAASMVLNYPADLIEITGLEIPGTSNKDLYWMAHNGSLRLAWFSLESQALQSSDAWIFLNIKCYPETKVKEIVFTLDPVSQLSNADGKLIEGVSLIIPKLSLREQVERHDLVAYPNPFTEQTDLSITITEDGYVQLGLYDAVGNLVTILHEGAMAKGAHTIGFRAADLASGVYFCQMEVKTSYSKQLISRKLVILSHEGK